MGVSQKDVPLRSAFRLREVSFEGLASKDMGESASTYVGRGKQASRQMDFWFWTACKDAKSEFSG